MRNYKTITRRVLQKKLVLVLVLGFILGWTSHLLMVRIIISVLQ